MADDSLDDFPEMTPAQEEFVMWAMSSDVDTGGLCDCGHEGLGPSWHGGDCRGVNHALTKKVGELMERAHSTEAALRVMARETAALAKQVNRPTPTDAITPAARIIIILADRLEAARPKPTTAAFSSGWLSAVDTLRRMARRYEGPR